MRNISRFVMSILIATVWITFHFQPNLAQNVPEGYTTQVNGIQMYYQVVGQGSPLVLLHGFTGSSQRWEPFFADFAKHYRLIVPDLRGHGRSTNPTNKFTHRQSARDVFALLNKLEISQFKAMGTSTGGMTLIHMATQQEIQHKQLLTIMMN